MSLTHSRWFALFGKSILLLCFTLSLLGTQRSTVSVKTDPSSKEVVTSPNLKFKRAKKPSTTPCTDKDTAISKDATNWNNRNMGHRATKKAKAVLVQLKLINFNQKVVFLV